jgi:hypothetical protein
LQFQYLVAQKRVIFSCSFLHSRTEKRIGGPVPSCTFVPFVVQALTFPSRENTRLSFSKSADSNSPSHRDSLRASTHRALANPRLYKPFTGVTPFRTPHNPVLYSG